MTDRARIGRIIFFAVIFFALTVFIHNLGVFGNIGKGNLISLLFIRKDNIDNTLQGEIYPIAYYSEGKYSDASIADSETGKAKSLLSGIRDFVVIGKGNITERFKVEELTSSPFMCSKLLVGRGRPKDSSRLSNIFEHISSARSSRSRGVENKKDFDYTLKWTLATSRAYRIPAAPSATSPDVGRYKSDLLNVAIPLLDAYKSDDGTEGDIVMETLNLFDIDHDGKPEVSAKFKKMIRKKTKIYQGEKEWEEYNHDVVYLNLWLTYESDNPQVVLSLLSYEREGSWGRGHDLVGTLDVNGDGIEEVILRSSSWEVVEFEIYEYRNAKLERVFHGAGFGC